MVLTVEGGRSVGKTERRRYGNTEPRKANTMSPLFSSKWRGHKQQQHSLGLKPHNLIYLPSMQTHKVESTLYQL